MRTHTLIRATFVTILFSLPTLCLAQEARIVIPAGVVNQAYSQNVAQVLVEKYRVALKSSSPTPSFEWRIVGPAPSGLSIDPATGTVFGTPITAKAHLFRVEVLDRALSRPAPLRFLVSLQIAAGEAPVLVPLEPKQPSSSPTAGSTDNASVTIQNDADDAVEIPTVIPRKKFTLPIKIKKDAIRQLAVVAINKASDREVTALTPADLPRGEVLTSVSLDLEEGENTILVRDASTNELYREFNVTVRPTDVDPPDETDLELRHSGFVSEKEEETSVTVKVGPKVRKIGVAAFEKAEDGTLTKAMKEIKAPALKRDTDSYPVTVQLSESDVTKVTVTDLTPGSQVGEKSIEIKRDKAVNAKSGDSDETSPIKIERPQKVSTVPDKSVDTYVKVVKKSGIKKIRYQVTNGEKNHLSGDISVNPTDTTDDEKRIRIPILSGTNTIRVFDSADQSQQAIVDVICPEDNDNCATTFEPFDSYTSQNSRTIVGLEQSGASSASSETKPFVDFFFSTPFLFSTCPERPDLSEPPTPEELKKKIKYERCIAERLPRLGVWGNVRLTTTPDQVAAVGVLPSNFVNQLGRASNTVDLVQSFDFLMGLEGRLFSANGSFLSLLPGIRQRTHFYLAAGGGAINPLTARRELAQIFKIPPLNAPQRDDFIDRYGTPPTSTPAKEFVGLVPLDRDRFLRQWYVGLRLKTLYCDNADCTVFKNRFPAMVDFMVGQNEAVTGGNLHFLAPDPSDPTKTIRKRSYVIRFDAFYPFPLREANFLYFYGTAVMKVGAGGVRIQNPLFLDTAPGDVLITDPRVYIPPSDLQKMFQPSRDYYKIGVGINLTELFNRDKAPE